MLGAENRRSPVFDFLSEVGGARGVRLLTQPLSLLRRGPRLQPPMAQRGMRSDRALREATELVRTRGSSMLVDAGPDSD
jgi:hypothetical protein